MTSFAPVSGLIGGALIGLAAIILMLTIGRVAVARLKPSITDSLVPRAES